MARPTVIARILYDPASWYRDLNRVEPYPGIARQILLLLFVIACMISVLVSGRLTLRLLIDGAASFAFVPLAELAGFAVVWWMARSVLPFRRAAGIFLAGNLPWLVWCVFMTAVMCFASPAQVDHWTATERDLLQFGSAIPIVIWSAWLDFHYFSEILRASRGSAARYLAIQRAIAWITGGIYFLAFAIPPYVTRAIS